MIDLRYIKKLVDMIDASRVDTIEISSDKGMKIRISKTSATRAAVTLAPPLAIPAAAPPPGAIAATAAAARVEAVSTLVEVKSPMVGTFYPSPEPGAKPYVSVGSSVTRGQVLCIIEAMKIMNEIECEVTGIVREVCVTDAHPVEYGQVLFRVDPNG
jgi:acetyl-CoA carboxylase biotin carboxyl carrier protein